MEYEIGDKVKLIDFPGTTKGILTDIIYCSYETVYEITLLDNEKGSIIDTIFVNKQQMELINV